jgi:hypothetical protein
MQDNRSRFFLCTAMHDTQIPFEKALCLRLGLKKGELRLAPAEALQEVLSVGPGAANPFASAHVSASRVVLLLDTRLQEAPFWVHPMVNDRSVLITSAELTKFLEKRGKRGHFVDLSVTQFAVGPGQAPDLKEIASTVPEMKVKGEVKNMASGTESKKVKEAR